MTLSRRTALAALGGAAATPLARPALAQARTEWRMVTSWPRNLPGPGLSAQRLADTITAMSGGRLTVTLHAAGEIVPALEVFDAVAGGTAQMAHTAAVYWAGKLPAAPFFTTAPFGLTPSEHLAWLQEGGGQALWDELYAPSGLKPFMAGNTGVQMGGWFRRPVESLDDLKGLRIRIVGFGALAMQRLGAQPVTLPAGEIQLALQSGLIDAVEFLGPSADFASGFHRVVKTYHHPGWSKPNGAGEALVALSAWQSLPDDLKAIVRTACAEAAAHGLAQSDWMNGDVLARLEAEAGVTVAPFPDEVLAALHRESQAVIDEVAARDDLSRRIVESWRAARAHQRRWTDLTGGFVAARERVLGR